MILLRLKLNQRKLIWTHHFVQNRKTTTQSKDMVAIENQWLSLIAALHFNENYGWEQAKTSAGSERIRIVFQNKNKGNSHQSQSQFPKLIVCNDVIMYMLKIADNNCL